MLGSDNMPVFDAIILVNEPEPIEEGDGTTFGFCHLGAIPNGTLTNPN